MNSTWHSAGVYVLLLSSLSYSVYLAAILNVVFVEKG